MAVKATTWRIRGMNRDTDPLVFSNEFAYENRNIRITASSDSTLLGITNIKGTSKIQNIELQGTPIGTATISNYLILFTTIYKEEATNPVPNENYPDTIYRIKFTGDEVEANIIAHGNFNFSTLNPIETIPYWEAEDVINIYWTDGRNQIRKINIVDSGIFSGDGNITPIDSVDGLDFITSFDSAPIEDVTIEKQYSVGNFPSGVIQYFITAYNKFGNETNILYESPLYYMSPSDRGGTAEASNVNSFKLSILVSNQLGDFDYLRVYSTHRTSLNADVAAYIVSDIQLHGAGTYTIVDTGHGLESIDPTSLLYKEREPFSAGTFAQKDNVLFIGDVSLLGDTSEDFKTIRNYFSETPINYTETSEEVDYYAPTGVYPYDSNLDENNLKLKGFKCHDFYKIGVQFQRKTGEWTSVIPIKFADGHDWIQASQYPSVDYDKNKVLIPKLDIGLDHHNQNFTKIKQILEEDYIAVRAVIAEPILGNKSIRCQGILCPTLYNIQDRKNNSPYSVSSWFIRPMALGLGKPKISYSHNEQLTPSFSVSFTEYESSSPLDPGIKHEGNVVLWGSDAEIQNAVYTNPYLMFSDDGYGHSDAYKEWELQSTNYIVDQNILTLYSPDINDNTVNYLQGNYKVRIVGLVPITSYYSDYIIQTSSAKLSTKATGVINKDILGENINYSPSWLISDCLWNDAVRRTSAGTMSSYTDNFFTYVWHRQGSLNNDRNLDNTDVSQTAVLSHKIYSNLKYSYCTSYFKDIEFNDSPNIGIDLSSDTIEVNMFNSNEATAIRVGDHIYMGNVDKVATWVPYKEDSNFKTDRSDEDYAQLSNGYPIIMRGATEDSIHSVATAGDVQSEYKVGIEPVSIKYKSTPHLVFQLPQNNWKKTILPNMRYGDYTGNIVNSPLLASRTDPFVYFEDYDSSDVAVFNMWDLAEHNNELPKDEGTYCLYSTGLAGYLMDFIRVDGEGNGTYIKPSNVHTGTYVVGENKGNIYPIFKIMAEPTGDLLPKYYYESPRVSDYISQDGIYIVGDEEEITSVPENYYIAKISQQERQWIFNIGGTQARTLPMLYLAEVYEDISADDIYGTNYENIRWNVASEAVPISTWIDEGNLIVSGDTYFQRWDCLKTYPFTNEDQNSVVEIVSFMVETQNNIAARTDRNRGIQDNTPMSPTNFNLYNEVYNQSQDFISNVYLENSDLVNNNFPNTIYWSLAKTLREEVDTWAAITLSNSLDMDGDKGRVNAIRRYNNNLLVFQDTGLAQVLYNENMQIASTTGVPIEIANSGLVSGKRYISNTIGCENKWTIVTGENSLYFMDSFNKGIYKFDNQLTNLTSSLGFNSWADNIKIGKWLPETNDENVFLAGYDKQNKEVHFMDNNESLVYSEQLSTFMTFMDVKRTPFISNVEDRVIAVHDDAESTNYSLHTLNTGDYNTFFGTPYPFYTQVIANPEPTLDKIFNVLEFRADCLDTDYKVTSDMPFNKFRIWNEYQDSGNISLQLKSGRPSNLKKKFRIWRVNNFRNGNNRDRIRNPWAFFRLTNDEKKNVKVTLHDMVMHYFA